MSKLRILVIIVLLLCFFGTIALAEDNSSESVQASSMRLMQTEGIVTLTDQNGEKLALRNRMRLYSGCEVSTEEQSRAGILRKGYASQCSVSQRGTKRCSVSYIQQNGAGCIR